MSTISPLRQRMIEDMNARKRHPLTQKGHIRGCKQFVAFLKRTPDTATSEHIRRFQLHLAESGVSICNRNRTMTGLRFLFRVTLRRLDLAAFQWRRLLAALRGSAACHHRSPLSIRNRPRRRLSTCGNKPHENRAKEVVPPPKDGLDEIAISC